MTDSQVAKVVDAIEIIEAMGHGSVEVIIQNGKILDIVKKERERIN